MSNSLQQRLGWISLCVYEAVEQEVHRESLYLRRELCAKSHSACEAGVSIKPGAQAPGSDHKDTPKPVKTGDSVKFQSFAHCRGLRPFLFGTLTWGLRPRLYAYACYRRLRHLGLAPQALCLRLLSHAKKYHSISTLGQSPSSYFLRRPRSLAGVEVNFFRICCASPIPSAAPITK